MLSLPNKNVRTVPLFSRGGVGESGATASSGESANKEYFNNAVSTREADTEREPQYDSIEVAAPNFFSIGSANRKQGASLEYFGCMLWPVQASSVGLYF